MRNKKDLLKKNQNQNPKQHWKRKEKKNLDFLSLKAITLKDSNL